MLEDGAVLDDDAVQEAYDGAATQVHGSSSTAGYARMSDVQDTAPRVARSTELSIGVPAVKTLVDSS